MYSLLYGGSIRYERFLRSNHRKTPEKKSTKLNQRRKTQTNRTSDSSCPRTTGTHDSFAAVIHPYVPAAPSFAPASPIDPLKDTPPPSCDLQTEADARDRRRGQSHSQPNRTTSRHVDALGLASPAATPTPTLAPASPEAKNRIDAPLLPDKVSKETPPPIRGYAVANHQDAAVADHQDVGSGGASDTSWTRTRPSPIRNRTLLSRIPGHCRRRRLRYPHQPPEMPLPTTSTSSKRRRDQAPVPYPTLLLLLLLLQFQFQRVPAMGMLGSQSLLSFSSSLWEHQLRLMWG
ncbi:uncharacterized protein [Aegilops tauschii subsp. strangulata]|uniref:uncharacterized protein n=1 Tax=Aegilops tauschii subsp. strangulata TaxID=200361 RepID=UPI001E1CAA48|nr:uncharacterized protein LOC109741956 [Aegilops tauschii subsp. strangulata]